jgi:hypothetical protein
MSGRAVSPCACTGSATVIRTLDDNVDVRERGSLEHDDREDDRGESARAEPADQRDRRPACVTGTRGINAQTRLEKLALTRARRIAAVT